MNCCAAVVDWSIRTAPLLLNCCGGELVAKWLVGGGYWVLLLGRGFVFDLPPILHNSSWLLVGLIGLLAAGDPGGVADNAVSGMYILRAVERIRSNDDGQANPCRLSPEMSPSAIRQYCLHLVFRA